MFLATSSCDWKCCNDLHMDSSICQNQPLVLRPTITYYIDDIVESYVKNDITKAVVFGGLEPFLQFPQILNFIDAFRKATDDDIVIYTGYKKEELIRVIDILIKYKNIIIKYGRFKPNQKPHYDDILGIELVSDNQYAERIS